MSQESASLYFTIACNQQSIEDFILEYHLDQISQVQVWYADEDLLNLEQSTQPLGIRLNIGAVQLHDDFTQQVYLWLHRLKTNTNILQLAETYRKALHLHIQAFNEQSSGFHLTHQLLGLLSELNIEFHVHSHLNTSSEQETFTESLTSMTDTPFTITESASFRISSECLTAQQLQEYFQGMQFDILFDQGQNIRSQKYLKHARTSLLELPSRLNTEHHDLDQHLHYLVDQLHPYRFVLQKTFFNPHIQQYIQAHGHLENPHHRKLSVASIKALFSMGLSLDVDYYFAC